MSYQDTTNNNSENSGYHFGLALFQENPTLSRYQAGKRCAQEGLHQKKRYNWLNTEIFTRKALDTYLSEQTRHENGVEDDYRVE